MFKVKGASPALTPKHSFTDLREMKLTIYLGVNSYFMNNKKLKLSGFFKSGCIVIFLTDVLLTHLGMWIAITAIGTSNNPTELLLDCTRRPGRQTYPALKEVSVSCLFPPWHFKVIWMGTLSSSHRTTKESISTHQLSARKQNLLLCVHAHPFGSELLN